MLRAQSQLEKNKNKTSHSSSHVPLRQGCNGGQPIFPLWAHVAGVEQQMFPFWVHGGWCSWVRMVEP